MAAAAQCAAPTPKRYQRRRPERTLWYRIVQTHLETWLELASGEDGEAPPAHVERTFRRYLECGILAHAWHLNSMNLTTSFVLPPDDTDRLCDVAGQLMRHSPAYDSVVRDLGGTPAQAASAEQ